MKYLANKKTLAIFIYTVATSFCFNAYRHPNSSSRPSFQDILAALRVDEEKVLEIPADAAQSHPKADTLGAPIEAGAGMYQDICKKYCRYSPVTCSDMDYDDITG